jgi:hypothetical protein
MPPLPIPDAQRAALARAAELVEFDVLLSDEAWLDENGEAMAMVHRGLRQAREGEFGDGPPQLSSSSSSRSHSASGDAVFGEL